MAEKDNKKKKTNFSKEQKRRALVELSKGKSPDEVFEIVFENSGKLKSADKKYRAKLLHKWRNEMYNNKEVLNFQKKEMNNETLEYEIKNMDIEIENDEIETSLKKYASDLLQNED